MRILYITTIGRTMNFFRKFISELVQAGCTVDIACNDSEAKVPEFFCELGCKVYPIQTSRSPLDKGNLTAIKQLKKLVSENAYDIVHCHTPVAAMCTRLACRKARKQGTKVFYTAHGFHFYKGAPLKNWLLYYPVEKICSFFTDVLITINQEDYALAKKKMRANRVEYVPGVGIDLEKFGGGAVDRAEKRRELGIPEDATLLLSVGELNENKNHQIILKAMAELDEPALHYMIAGTGSQDNMLLKLVDELGLTGRVHLLGFRDDIKELCETADIFCFPSIREGLPVALMEAMACGLPVICSRIRGNIDLINEDGGIVVESFEVRDWSRAIADMLVKDTQSMGTVNKECVRDYSIEIVLEKMKSVYQR